MKLKYNTFSDFHEVWRQFKNCSARIYCGILTSHVAEDFMVGCLPRTDLAATRTKQG